jgi:hypothetical protein
MAKVYETIIPEVAEFISKQHIFFVATAPLSAEGHINLSPKGMDCFRIIGHNRVGYIDLTGSGNETSAHLAENGRVTFMFCSFEGAPNIVRLYGTGTTVLPGSDEWAALHPRFPAHMSARQIIVADVHRVSTSCGYSLPLMDFRAERDTLTRYWDVKGADALPDYQREKNAASIDGLPTPLGTLLCGDE